MQSRNVLITFVALVAVGVSIFLLVDQRKKTAAADVGSLVHHVLEGQDAQAEECYERLKKMDSTAIPHARKLLRSERNEVRELGVNLLQGLLEEIRETDPEGSALREVLNAIPDLVASLSDDLASVRGKAASALGWIGMDAVDTLPDLEKLLDDEDSQVRERVERALHRIRTGEKE